MCLFLRIANIQLASRMSKLVNLVQKHISKALYKVINRMINIQTKHNEQNRKK